MNSVFDGTLHYSENSTGCIVHVVAKSRTQLNNFLFTMNSTQSDAVVFFFNYLFILVVGPSLLHVGFL